MSIALSSALRPALSVFAALAMAVLAACSKGDAGKPAAAAAQAHLPTVGVLTVQLGDVGVATELPGRLEASRSADVRARAGGVVLKRLFEEGSSVKAGQALFRMDDSTYADSAATAQAQLAKAQANWAVADAKLKRYQPMAEKNIVSKQDFDLVLATERAAAADLQAAKAQLANAQTNLNRTTISAPISGHIGRALVSEGDLLSANDATVVARVQQTETLYINFTQSAAQVLQMRRDLAAGALQRANGAEAAAVKVVLDDGSIYPNAGRLLFTDMAVDEATGQVKLRAEVPNPQNLLLPGLFVKVRIEQASVPNAVLVPQQAITRGAQSDAVLVVNKDGSFAPRTVQIAKGMGTDWVVTGGLANGEQVLVSGQMKLMPGVEKVQTVPYADLLKHERAALAAPAAASASSAQPASAPKS
ncbi:MAG: efflux RND transporter periplasmic adaptor subunit [Brachymonas sp.]|jgi:membrane fusion protein (multidrug efflux system)